jgi:hypothetical protein
MCSLTIVRGKVSWGVAPVENSTEGGVIYIYIHTYIYSVCVYIYKCVYIYRYIILLGVLRFLWCCACRIYTYIYI